MVWILFSLFPEQRCFDNALGIFDEQHHKPDNQAKRHDGETQIEIIEHVNRRRVKIFRLQLGIFEDRVDKPHQ